MPHNTYNLTSLFDLSALCCVLDGEALHHLAQVRFAAQEELVIVTVEISSSRYSVEAPAGDLTGEGAEPTMTAAVVASVDVGIAVSKCCMQSAFANNMHEYSWAFDPTTNNSHALPKVQGNNFFFEFALIQNAP